MTKKNPERQTTYVELFDFNYVSFETLRNKMNELYETRHQYVNSELGISIDYSRGYYESVDICAKIYAYRLETDEEMNNRIEREHKLQAEREKWDRQAYERLKKKFGN
jgi:hypothetical protein